MSLNISLTSSIGDKGQFNYNKSLQFIRHIQNDFPNIIGKVEGVSTNTENKTKRIYQIVFNIKKINELEKNKFNEKIKNFEEIQKKQHSNFTIEILNGNNGYINIGFKEYTKGKAFLTLVKQWKISQDNIFKFGDSIGKKGNDLDLLHNQKNAYYVGKQTAKWIRRTKEIGAQSINLEGPCAVLKILNKQKVIQAIVSDFDNTLNLSPNWNKIEKNVASKLAKLMKEGTHVCIITGRGLRDMAPVIRDFFTNYFTKEENIATLPFSTFTFNGAIQTKASVWCTLLEKEDQKIGIKKYLSS